MKANQRVRTGLAALLAVFAAASCVDEKVVERIVETAARELGRDPTELRRLNMIQPEQFPYQTPVALEYDTGNYEASLDKALELLHRARESLVHSGSIAELVYAGHAARVRFESFPRPDVVGVELGGENWRAELAAAGRSGAVIRSALPGPDSRR